MGNKRSTFILLVLLLTLAATTFAALLTPKAYSAIYGSDERQEISRLPLYRPLARSIAVSVPNVFVKENSDGTFTMEEVEKLGGSSSANFCMDERFADQPIIGNCTGFLVGDRYLATAGHCVLPNGVVDDEYHPFCESFSWYFDFSLDEKGRTSEDKIPADKFYRCKRVVHAENIQIEGAPLSVSGPDFALIELDRPVVGAQPLKISDRKARLGESVFTIGHPMGLPAKFSGFAPVRANTSPDYFGVFLDSSGGNSGSPVFDVQKGILGILVRGHPVEAYQDPKRCFRINKCDNNGLNCNEESKFEGQQVSNYIQYMGPVLTHLRKAQSHSSSR